MAPSAPLPSGIAILNFDNHTSTFRMQMEGRLDGENAIKQGEGYMFDKMDEYRDNLHIQEKYGDLGSYITFSIIESAERFKRERRRPKTDEEDDDEIEII
jgi:hypothetical protein